ncbi:putative addiction module antidote protein [Pseudacidovorax sp. 1753]|uniref:helix-turn-helix domain-containing transcriptional regulator n=1 Tax=Pseudacidovorax sp. 1753 TaxID=3156419 RepID=UPI00339B4A1E
MKTSAYDVATHLRTPEEMTAYRDAWLEEAPDDAAGIARALGDIARARNMGRVISEANVSRDNLRS